MSISAAPIENTIRTELAGSRSGSRWAEIPASETAAWNDRLLRTSAPLYQYPYWNTSYRRTGIEPVYLCLYTGDQPAAYVCVLRIGIGRFKIGLVMRGPVLLIETPELLHFAIQQLREWALAAGYFFLRFTHADGAMLDQIEAAGVCRRLDSFPFHIDRSVTMHDLVVDQKENDQEMLSSFDREARRKIRRAEEARYEVRIGGTFGDLESLWHLFVEFFERKNIRFNIPLEGVLDVVRVAEPHGCVRIYSAWIDGKPVEALIVFRDSQMALCHFAALDVNGLAGRPSPSVLLHWVAMRDMFRLGTKWYNLEAGTGTLWQFKQQFRPRKVTYPSPVTMVINEQLYRLWSMTALRAVAFVKWCAGILIRCSRLGQALSGGRARAH